MDCEHSEYEVDEYLWPLTGNLLSVDWHVLAEELEVRTRLREILAHVREMHVQPRVRRLGSGASKRDISAVTQAVIAGPDGGPPWAQTLKEPVPRALRQEWMALAERLRDIDTKRGQGRKPAAD